MRKGIEGREVGVYPRPMACLFIFHRHSLRWVLAISASLCSVLAAASSFPRLICGIAATAAINTDGLAEGRLCVVSPVDVSVHPKRD